MCKYNRCIACTITNKGKFYLLTYLFNTINAYYRCHAICWKWHHHTWHQYNYNACSLQKKITHLWQLSPIFPRQTPVWYGFPWQPGPDHPPDSREFWDTDADTGVVPLVCLGSQYHLKLLKTNRYYTQLKYSKFFYNLFFSIYMLAIYLCIVNICGVSIVWKFVQMKLCPLVSVYIKQRLCFHYLLGDLYSLVWSNFQNIRK